MALIEAAEATWGIAALATAGVDRKSVV